MVQYDHLIWFIVFTYFSVLLPRALKLLLAHYCLRITIPIMSICTPQFPAVYTYLSLKPHDVLRCLGNLFIISALQNNSTAVHRRFEALACCSERFG